ncbi:MAG: site-specific DNA-methyltransferase [Corallococcus sp.]|nr:site-specific DNA-methyltransferase [Corallococcus sp.]
MEKLKMMSKDKIQENIIKIQQLFPNAVTEVLRDGKSTLAVDFDVLKQELADTLIDDKELRYQFTWPDKQKAILLANTPISATLRPCKEESVDFDNTQNLYIEGDNLDVLKLLQETYLGKIKMIYIDPPYNTGNDFVYNDDFVQDSDEYADNSGQYDDYGNRLVPNPESNGRFHTDWLNMIYPRLRLAKDLLSDDGVLLISMADNELANQLKVCEEIFGKSNIEVFVWKKKGGAGNTERVLGVLTEYVIACFNNKKPGDLNYQNFEREYKFCDEIGKYNLEGIEKTNLGGYERKTMQFAITDPKTGVAFYPSENMRWTLGESTALKMIDKGKLYFDYKANKVKRIKRPEDYEESENVYYNLLLNEGSLATAKDECSKLLGNREYFDTPKPTVLLHKLLTICSKKDSLILDFFSGSATTAHAVMQLNAEDGGHRKFIMVQLPEVCDEKSEAYKAGYKNICEIGKERIRRAGAKIKQENGLLAQNLDVGFRVLKLDSSNMQPVYYRPEEYRQSLLDDMTDNIKPDRTPLDLLFQVMLELGKPLSAKIEEKEIAGKKVFIVDDNDLIACFDNDITDEVVKTIAQLKPLYAVFRDSSLANDSTATNFDQIFATYSPNTIRKVL